MVVPVWLTARPVAHRGLHDEALAIVENTTSAALAAVAAEFAVECDVQLAADGKAVVFHDLTLDRLTEGNGLLRNHTAAELAKIPFRVGHDRIPTLGAFLNAIAGRTPVFIEIKSRFDGDLDLARRVAQVMRRRDEPIALMSFDDAIVAALAELVPLRPRGIVAQARFAGREWEGLSPARRAALAALTHIGHSKPDFVAWRVGDLPHSVVEIARLFGLPVLTWTVRTAGERQTAAAFADQIIFEGFRP